MGWTLSNFIRGYQIYAKCTPTPYRGDGLYRHKCMLQMAKSRRILPIPYVTPDPKSVQLVPGKPAKSKISTFTLLYTIACEAALYEIAKCPLFDVEGSRIGVNHCVEIWSDLVFRGNPPPEAELNLMYQNSRRVADNLRNFLDGPQDATIYKALISGVDEVAGFVYNWVTAYEQYRQS